jgi:carbonic anhydrase
MKEVLNILKAGALRFREEVYPERKEAYERAAREPQQPHTLVITCADSRIDPEAIMQASPGEIFVTRNVGNIVPAYGEMLGGVSAVIEYAVSGLKVEHVVVCGHSDCGAMKALLRPQSTTGMPTVTSWLTNARSALMVAEAHSVPGEQPDVILRRVTEQNVLMQIAHLKTHPAVAAAIAQGRLTISGWVYDIGAGEVCISNDGSGTFEPLRDSGEQE